VILALTGAGCVDTPSPADPGGPQGDNIQFAKVTDADFPIAVDFAPDGRIFYTEKATGRVRIVKNNALLDAPFVTVNVSSISERGLLGIALHPDFANNGFVYVFYTRSGNVALGAESNRVARFVANGDVAAAGEKTIIDLPVSAAGNHNGGNIRFGPDGKLYVTIGELAAPDTAQDVSKLQGKILRLNDDGSTPDDNPMVGSLVYAYGLRNSFDFTFDPVNDDIVATENGPTSDDELNCIVAGGNYGWPEVVGFADASEADFVAATPNYHDPLIAINPVTAPTGVDFSPNTLFGAKDVLYYGEYKTGRIWRIELNNARNAVVSQSQFAIGIPDGITDVAFAPDGAMYVLTGTAIWRVTPED
jgi:glucose/arabinose dehydrogenase